MGIELESVWDAMKGVHYRRTIEQLEESIRDTKRLEEALTAALNTVVDAAHAQAGTFWFYDRFGDGRIRPKAVYGGGDLGDFSLLPGEGIAGQVISTGEPQIIADCQKDPRWAGRADAKTGFRTETMICVPLALDKMVFGSIQIINRTDNMAFDSKDLDFVIALSEATADLFRKRGLLDDYLASRGDKNCPDAVTFDQIFFARDEREMELALRRVNAFSALRVTDQDAVLRMAREMFGYFGGSAGRKRSFGFRRK